jgi:hypothetical protein
VGVNVIGDRDYQAAGAFLGMGDHYERTLGGRYDWNLSPWYTQANPYVFNPPWPAALM